MAATGPRFRYFLQIILGGGIDPILTLDAKTRREVDRAVDIPYAAADIVDTPDGRLGPLCRELAPIASRGCIVRGVAVNTANHQTGFRQIDAMRTRVTTAAPSLTEILGSRRAGQAVGSVTMGHILTQVYTPGWFGDPILGADPGVFEHLDAASPDDLAAAASALRAQSHVIRRRAGATGRAGRTIDSMTQIAELYERLGNVPPFRTERWTQDPPPDRDTEQLQRALWLIENDLAAAICVVFGGMAWDSHFDNLRRQTSSFGAFSPRFARLVRELSTRRNQFGVLADQTLIVVSSEIGRHPSINLAQGKDHFPEIPVLMVGPAVPGGRIFGETTSWMAGKPVELATGKPSRGGHSLVLDDIGTTILHLAGCDPGVYGYTGRILEFLT